MIIPSLLLASAALTAAQIPFDLIDYEVVEFDPIKYDGTLEPCAAINALQSSGETEFPASLAFACLNSVPVDMEGNTALIEELQLLWQFESDLGWLKSPPETFELGPTDLIAELEKIKNNLHLFASEYEVQLAIWVLTTHTGNFHMNWRPDILQIFRYRRPVAIIAASDDGKSLPKIYLADEAEEISVGSTLKYSAVKTINGEDVYKYLENVAALSPYIDLDGQLNSLYWKGSAEGSAGAFYRYGVYQGDYTNITFENGTLYSHEDIATTEQSFETVVDGGSFFLTFCTGAISGFTDPSTGEKKQSSKKGLFKRATISVDQYPTPIAQDNGENVAGYFMTSQGHQDTAVLKVISFDAETPEAMLDFQSTVRKFLAECVKTKKQKLIVDLRENGGGAVNLLLDLFKQLFPKDEPFSGQDNRVHETYAAIADHVEEIFTNKTLLKKFQDSTGAQLEDVFRDWAYWQWTTVDGKNFKDMEEFVGPYIQNDDLVTSTWRYNLSLPKSVPSEGFQISSGKGTAQQPFAKENIVMFTDALCGSSCASFHEEMKNIAGIKSVVVGGRPSNAPMQAVTGAKGGEVRPINTIPQISFQLINITENIGATEVDDIFIVGSALVSEVLVRAGDDRSTLQFQEQIRKGDATETPLQFIYEAADCKIFYTLKGIFNPEEAWKAAWNAFVDEKNCVPSSTRHKSSISGGFKPYGSGPLKPGEMGTGNNSTSHATLSSSVPAHIATGKPNLSSAPIANPTRWPGNGTGPRPGGPTATIHPGNATNTGPVTFFTGGASNLGSGSMVFGAVMGALVAFL